MITLHGHPYSYNSRKVQWLLEEIGEPYRFQSVDLLKGAQKAPEYVSLNPNARVPTIDDDGFVLWESNAILWYLADRHRGSPVHREVPRERALVGQWVSWQASDLGRAVIEPWLMKFFSSVGMATFDPDRHCRLVEAAEKPLAIFEAHLRGRHFVEGDRLSIADIALAETVGLCPEAGIDLEPHPGIRAWFAPLAERPAFVKTRP